MTILLKILHGKNDVWVIGQEEEGVIMSSVGDEIISSQVFTSTPQSRFDGQPEYGGIIQVTDLGAVEPWVLGKLEFRIVILDSKGVVIKEKEFDKRKRSHFRNKKWYDYGYFVGNWNLPAIGNWTTEKWMEMDGGKSSSVTFKVPASGPGGIPFDVTIPSKEKDDDLGLSMIQFTEPMDQVYNLTHINIKRKHQ